MGLSRAPASALTEVVEVEEAQAQAHVQHRQPQRLQDMEVAAFYILVVPADLHAGP